MMMMGMILRECAMFLASSICCPLHSKNTMMIMMMMKAEMKFVATVTTGGRGIFSGGVMFSENNAKFHVLPE